MYRGYSMVVCKFIPGFLFIQLTCINTLWVFAHAGEAVKSLELEVKLPTFIPHFISS